MNIKKVFKIYSFFLLFLTLLCNCYCTSRKVGDKVEVLPLSPYVDVDSLVTEKYVKRLKVEYFLITNAPTDTSKLSNIITQFNYLNPPSDVHKMDRVQRVFYKQSLQINQNFIYSDENRLEDHIDDLIAEYHWINQGEISFIEFYKNGNLISTLRDVKLITQE